MGTDKDMGKGMGMAGRPDNQGQYRISDGLRTEQESLYSKGQLGTEQKTSLEG